MSGIPRALRGTYTTSAAHPLPANLLELKAHQRGELSREQLSPEAIAIVAKVRTRKPSGEMTEQELDELIAERRADRDAAGEVQRYRERMAEQDRQQQPAAPVAAKEITAPTPAPQAAPEPRLDSRPMSLAARKMAGAPASVEQNFQQLERRARAAVQDRGMRGGGYLARCAAMSPTILSPARLRRLRQMGMSAERWIELVEMAGV